MTTINYIYTYIDYIIILVTYYNTKTEHLYQLKHSLGTALSPSLSSVYSYLTYMIGLTKWSHVAPKMKHVTFCDSIVRFDWCRTNRIYSVCGVTWIPLCAKDGSVITWGRGEEETSSRRVVSTQCAEGLRATAWALDWTCFSLVRWGRARIANPGKLFGHRCGVVVRVSTYSSY